MWGMEAQRKRSRRFILGRNLAVWMICHLFPFEMLGLFSRITCCRLSGIACTLWLKLKLASHLRTKRQAVYFIFLTSTISLCFSRSVLVGFWLGSRPLSAFLRLNRQQKVLMGDLLSIPFRLFSILLLFRESSIYRNQPFRFPLSHGLWDPDRASLWKDIQPNLSEIRSTCKPLRSSSMCLNLLSIWRDLTLPWTSSIWEFPFHLKELISLKSTMREAMPYQTDRSIATRRVTTHWSLTLSTESLVAMKTPWKFPKLNQKH